MKVNNFSALLLATLLSGSFVAAQAGVGRSVGGHGMSGAHSFSSSRNASNKYTVSHSSEAVPYSSKSGTTTVVNNENGNTLQSKGTINYGQTTKESLRNVSINANGKTYDTEKSTVIGRDVETGNKTVNVHQSTTKVSNAEGDVAYHGRNTTVVANQDDGSKQMQHNAYTQSGNAAGQGKYRSKSTLVNPSNTEQPISHTVVVQ